MALRTITFILAIWACALAPRINAQQESKRLDPGAANAVIDMFKRSLDERWSYRHANGADFDSAISRLRQRINGEISENELGIGLQKIIALGIDGHSRVSGFSLTTGGRLPFLIEISGPNLVATDSKRTAFLAPGFPFLTKIDGRSVAEWCTAASELVVKGSPQLIRQRSVVLLRELDYWRDSLKLPKKDTVEIELTDRQGKQTKTLTLPVAKSPLAYDPWPSAGSRLLPGNIGYLRLTTMQTSTAVPEIKTWMPRFRDTAGLIVDVRDNNGGDRDPLLLIYSYLAAPNDPPRVFNAAAYRLHPEHPQNYLAEEHRMYRLNAPEWSPAQRPVVAKFAKTFKPEWPLPKDQFSDWHYIALTRLDAPDIYHYRKPVIVLLNNKSFSATDVFLAALKGMRNVTLVGTPSSGGSAYSQEIPLGSGKLSLRIGTMASFQADGKLFDSHGIRPDVIVSPDPEFFIGERDNVLEAAIRLIGRARR